MKYVFFSVLILTALTNCAQDTYPDSIYAFQQQYKKDLFEIIKGDTAFVRFYRPDIHYRVKASLQKLSNQPFFAMRTSDGKPRQARKFAIVRFRLNGSEHTLTCYQMASLLESEKNKDLFFLPFLDEGSGELTYGGGRYLDFKLKDIVNNSLLIDFNKAYNPYCAFTTGYSCPIPPRENALNTIVKAGEMSFGKKVQK